MESAASWDFDEDDEEDEDDEYGEEDDEDEPPTFISVWFFFSMVFPTRSHQP